MTRAAVPRYGHIHGGQPTREIRMVYHNANGVNPNDSRISIFAGRGGHSRGLGAYYNPITHTQMQSGAAGARYHSRGQPSSNGGYHEYSAQRRRVTPGHWY